MAQLGLTTYRLNNNIKSTLLLIAFPFLLLLLLGLVFLLFGLAGNSDQMFYALDFEPVLGDGGPLDLHVRRKSVSQAGARLPAPWRGHRDLAPGRLEGHRQGLGQVRIRLPQDPFEADRRIDDQSHVRYPPRPPSALPRQRAPSFPVCT